MESITKVPSDNVYDLIIIDECESILKQLCSTTMKNNHVEAFQRLETFIRTSSKNIIWADAFILNRSLRFIKYFKESVIMVRNRAPIGDQRTCMAMNVDKMHREIEGMARGGKKQFYCSASKTVSDTFMIKMKDHVRNEDHDLYHEWFNTTMYFR